MPTPKKPAISKHKTNPTQVQSFDIIPPEKVMPSASSRPVITANKPQQVDNTLMQPSTAPPLVRRRKVVLTPPSDAQGDDASFEVPGLPIEDASQTGQPTAPELSSNVVKDALPPAPGIEEILAKKASRAAGPKVVAPVASAPAPASPARIEELELTPDTPAPQIDDRIDEPQPEAPAVDENLNDDIPEGMPDLSVDSTDQPESPKPVDFVPEAAETVESKPQKEAAHEQKDPKPATRASEPKEDSVEAALTEDKEKDGKPQAHSPALKEALNDLGSDVPADGEEHPHHHELYGGKPVIAIHRHRGGSSAVAVILWLLVCLVMAVAAIDLLADAGIIEIPYNIPITDFIKNET